MKKNFPKISFLVILSTFGVVFLLSATAGYIVSLTRLNFATVIPLFALSSAVSAIIIAIGLFAFTPTFTDAIVVLRRLLRFESLSNPLLLRLSYEAPGTFHHAVNVSILAQKAAKSIGADTLLVRIGAYYHDLGKLDSPGTFVENQSGAEIPRSENIELIKKSAQHIIRHVKDGVEIARQNHLPEEVIAIIAEHHGTTKALFFYEEAKRQGLKTKKTDFKYDGPIPQSKESAIVMIADSVEATARAIPDLTQEGIAAIIEETMLDKINDNQLKASTLSDRDLAKIRESLADTLSSIYHQRITYKVNEEISAKR